MIRSFARGLFRNPLLILICLTVALGAAYLVTEQMTPQYASSVRVLVSGGDAADAEARGDRRVDRELSEARTSTYAAVVDQPGARHPGRRPPAAGPRLPR